MTDKALDERRNHVSNDLYHFEIKKSLEFFTSKFTPFEEACFVTSSPSRKSRDGI